MTIWQIIYWRWYFFKEKWQQRLCRHKYEIIGLCPVTYKAKTKYCRKCSKLVNIKD